MWIIIAVVIIAVVVLVLILNGAERRIPVQYSKKMAGRKMVGGQVIQYSAEGKYSGRIPNHLCIRPSCLSHRLSCRFVGKSDIKGIGGTLIKDAESNNWLTKPIQLSSAWA